jgi:TolB-like protein/Flp pilus assembly protein TadD
MDMRPSGESVVFEGHRFEPRTGRLFRGPAEVRLTPKASAVLRLLLARAGHPVTKEELAAAAWDGAMVSGDALQSCVQELRKALGDDSREPHFIETRHRQGYRFVASLAAREDSPPPTAAAASSTPAIAVLPFADMSPQRDLDYLCEGLAEELIGVLTRIEGLRVVARTVSFHFREPGMDLRTVGQRLGVTALLEGSIRRSGDHLRVAVQLVDAGTGYHRWSRRFDRRLDDLFAFQDEIAASVAESLRGTVLTEREKRTLSRPPTSGVAYEYYLRGRQTLHGMTRADLMGSAGMFERALQEDPRYGPAMAGLATVHATLYEWFGAHADDLRAAEQASQLALELCPGLAEAHVARANALALSRRYAEAAREFDEAARINPSLFDAHYYYGRMCVASGDAARAALLFERAAALRREDYQSPLFQAKALFLLGREGAARDAASEGLRRAEHALALNPEEGRAWSLGSLALLDAGDRARAIDWSRRSLDLNPEDTCTLVNHACLTARTGGKDEALDLLDGLFARGLGKRDWVDHDPDFDPFRGDPRFERMLERLK